MQDSKDIENQQNDQQLNLLQQEEEKSLKQPSIQQSLENNDDILLEKELCNLCDSNSCLQHQPISIHNGQRIRKLDIHSHILPSDIPDFRKQFGYGGFIRLKEIPDKPDKMQMWKDNTFFREVDDKCFSAEARLIHMNEEGVDVQLLSTVPVMFSYFAKPQDGLIVSQFLNNHISSICKKYPSRFIGLGTLPMQNTKMAVQELIRCIKELNLVGVEIGSHIENWNLDDERFYPLWETAEKLNACIFVHPWEMMGEKEMTKYWLPWLVGMPAETCRAICCLMFGGIMKKHPNLKFCFAHGGGSFVHTIGRIQHGYLCRPDLVQIHLKGEEDEPLKYPHKFWVDSLVHDEKAFEYLLSIMGEKKICLGTDYPFPLGECYPLKKCGELVETIKTLNNEQKSMILWYNGLDFIGKKDEDFPLSNDVQKINYEQNNFKLNHSKDNDDKLLEEETKDEEKSIQT